MMFALPRLAEKVIAWRAGGSAYQRASVIVRQPRPWISLGRGGGAPVRRRSRCDRRLRDWGARHGFLAPPTPRAPFLEGPREGTSCPQSRPHDRSQNRSVQSNWPSKLGAIV